MAAGAAVLHSVQPVGPLRWSGRGIFVAAGMAVATLIYAIVRISVASAASGAWLSGLLLAAELGAALRALVYALTIVRAKRSYTPQEVLLRERPCTFHVRVLIPCFNEHLELIQQTVFAAAHAHLPAGALKTIYLCDDGRDPAKRAWVESIAHVLPHETGCFVEAIHYVSDRPAGDGNGKSNNLNHALRSVIYAGVLPEDIPLDEVVAVLDADMVARPHIFMRLLPYLAEPQDAIVQSPQNWHNYDPASDVLDHSARLKWLAAIPQLVNGWGGIVCMGSNFVLRARALAVAGWWPTWTVSEGIGLAQELKRAGYRGYFVDEVLAVGEVPTRVRDKRVQFGRLIRGYFTNWVSLKHGSLWDPSKTVVEKITANGVNRDLICGLYAPLLLALPPLALIFGVPLLNLGAPGVLAAWLPSWLALYLATQATLQFHCLGPGSRDFPNAAAARDVGANWLANLFGSLLYWDIILAAVPAVLKAELSGCPLGFAVTPKSIRTALHDKLRTLSQSVVSAASMTVGAAIVTVAPRAGSILASSCSGAAGGLQQARLAALRSLGLPVEHLACSAAASNEPASMGAEPDAAVHVRPVDAPGQQQMAGAAHGKGAPAASLPAVIDPLSKTYSERAGPEPAFPWRQLWVPLLTLALTLVGVVCGVCGASLGRSGAQVLAPAERLALTLWCLHNAVAPALLIARAVVGDSLGLRAACRAVPCAMLAAGLSALAALAALAAAA